MSFLYWWERSDDEEFDDEYYEGLWGIRLTPVAGDGAGGHTGDVEGETRPAPEHDG